MGKASFRAGQRRATLAFAVKHRGGENVMKTQQRQQTKGVFALTYYIKRVIPTVQEGLLLLIK